MASALDRENKELQHENMSLSGRNRQLEGQKWKLREDLRRLMTMTSALLSKNKELQRENTSLRGRNCQLEQQMEMLCRENAELKEELSRQRDQRRKDGYRPRMDDQDHLASQESLKCQTEDSSKASRHNLGAWQGKTASERVEGLPEAFARDLVREDHERSQTNGQGSTPPVSKGVLCEGKQVYKVSGLHRETASESVKGLSEAFARDLIREDHERSQTNGQGSTPPVSKGVICHGKQMFRNNLSNCISCYRKHPWKLPMLLLAVLFAALVLFICARHYREHCIIRTRMRPF